MTRPPRPTLLRAFASVGGLTLASRILGLVRDVVVAATFGAGFHADAFFAAFRIPNLLRRFTAEGALTQGFVPVYNHLRQNHPDRANLLARETAGLLAAALLVLAALGILFAPQVVNFVAPGFSEVQPAQPSGPVQSSEATQPSGPSESNLPAQLLRITFPYIFFISLVALAAGLLNSVGKFAAPAFAPVLLNLSMIGCALVLAPRLEIPIHALAWGVLLGGVLQFALVAFALRKNNLFPVPVLVLPPSADAARVLKMMGQSALGGGAAQVNLLINLAIASLLAEGSISWLYYADRLMELPAGLLGAALATVALPTLSRQAEDPAAFSNTLDKSLRLVVFLAAPASAGLVLLAGPIVSAVFMHGEFSQADADMTSRAAAAYGIGIVGLAATRPLAAAFFARRDAATPVKIAVAALVAAQAMNALFILGLGLAHVGLALSVGLAASANAFVLLVVLVRRKWFAPAAGWGVFAARILCALAAMAALLFFAAPEVAFWRDENAVGVWSRALVLLALVGGGGGIYFLVAAALGARISEFRMRIG